MHPGQAWLKKDIDDATTQKTACLFVGLMRYKPLSDNL